MWKELIMILGIALFGLMCVSPPLIRRIEGKECKEKIKGVCKKIVACRSSNCIYYSISFLYYYENKKYVCDSIEDFTSKQAKKFTVGEEYELYINPKKPKDIRALPYHISIGMVLLFLLGILISIGAIQQFIQWLQTYLL